MSHPPSSGRESKAAYSRRQFLCAAGAGMAAVHLPAVARAASRSRPRVGAVAYAYNYSLGLFGAYAKRSGEKWDVFKFLTKTREAGGEMAQLYFTMVDKLDEAGLKQVRRKADELDLRLELHGGGAQRKEFERTLRLASALGIKMVGCSFGMLMRPGKISTLDAWDQHFAACRARLRQLVDAAQPMGLVIGVENHLDFTTEELRDLVKSMDSRHAGVVFDIGNTVGTLDDPSEAADILGPMVVALHYKDFAVEETERGFRFTMVPLGYGSLQLPEITRRLRQHVPPDLDFAIELINGQQLEVNWLDDGFWTAFRHKPAREIAATLRHIRGKAIDRSEFKPQSEVAQLPHEAHVQFEQDRITRSIAHLKGLF
jgi:3-oxoisoapionate decarboxylase